MSRMRCKTILWALAALVTVAGSDAHAAAEVHRLNFVVSAIPTSIQAKNFNEEISRFNQTYLDPRGVKGLGSIHSGWLFDGAFRYFVRPNFAVEFGAGQLRRNIKQEFFPALGATVQMRAEVLSVPIHVGGAYYLAPYRQGDFEARAFVGGGYMGSVYNRARIQVAASGLGPIVDRANTFEVTGHGDSPGFYVEAGAHLFFATRYSLIFGVQYRSAMIRYPLGTLEYTDIATGEKYKVPMGTISDADPALPLSDLTHLDLGGLGGRFGFALGF